jgi:uncharacterized protein (TIGR01777 family)
MEKILIGGGSGFIGKALSEKLTSEGYDINIFTRNPDQDSPYKLFYWNPPENFADDKAFEGISCIINLTGENISGKRWSKKQKEKIEKSRKESTELFRQKINDHKLNIKKYISSSAIGYYGTFNSEKIFKEDDPPGNDFLSEVCMIWENAVNKIKDDGIQTAILRTGVVFNKEGGAFPKLIQTLKYNNLAVLGSGKQYIPWIHIEDLTSMILYLIKNNKLTGVYNAVGPVSYTQKTILKKIQEYSKKKMILTKIPGFILKLIFGEMASILLYGSRISSEKIEKSGFEFKYRKFEDALTELI